jgi:hypothetical protein
MPDAVPMVELVIKNPWVIGLAFGFMFLIGGWLLWLLAQGMKKDILTALTTYTTEHNKVHEELVFVKELRSEIHFIRDNFEIFKNAMDIVSPSSTIAIYKIIKNEFVDLFARFTKNYNNGSHKEKALTETSICSSKLIQVFNSTPIKASDRKSMFALVDFLVEKCTELAEQLGKEGIIQSVKISLVNIYFNNFNVIIDFAQVKEIEFENKKDEIIHEILRDNFDKLMNSFTIKRPSLADEL